jgi:anti-sigma factor RsiW
MSRTIHLPNLDAAEPQVSGFELRRYVEGELTEARRAAIAQLLATDAALLARHDALANEVRAEHAAFALEMPHGRFLMEAEERAAPRGLLALLARMRMPVGFGALAASAAAVFFLVRAPDDGPTYDGLKGGARIGFFVKGAQEGGAHLGHDGEQLTQGDQVQFAVRDDDSKGVMVIVGVDGRGQVSIYAKRRVDTERAKGAHGANVLESSIVLDDAVGAERFWVVYADGDVGEVARAVEDAARTLAGADLAHAARLPLGAAYEQSSVHIVKVK